MEREIDVLLLNDIKKGDSHAFELLFKKYYAPLCLFAVKYTHDIDSAREVVQNLFVYLWENHANVRIDHSPKAYMTTAVRRNCIRYIQQRYPTQSIDTLPENEHASDELNDSLELEELYRQLSSAIEQLPAQCRKIFKLSRFEEMKYSEIAGQLGISIKTVEAQMGKALRLLRQQFEGNIMMLWILLRPGLKIHHLSR